MIDTFRVEITLWGQRVAAFGVFAQCLSGGPLMIAFRSRSIFHSKNVANESTLPRFLIAQRVAVCIGAMLMFCADATATLLLQYTFDDQTDPTANSGSLGAGYNGNLLNNVTFVPAPPGGSGFAGSFDGAANDDSVVIPIGNESAFDIGNGDFSLVARMNTTYMNTQGSFLLGLIWKQALGSNSAYGFGMRRESGRLHLYEADGTQSGGVQSTIPINDGITHEVMGIREGDCLCLYIDGQLNATSELPAGFGSTNNNQPLVIGGRTVGSSSTDDWEGLIDEVRVYDEALATCTVPEPAAGSLWICALLSLAAGMSKRRHRAGAARRNIAI